MIISQIEFMDHDEDFILALQTVRATFEALRIRYFAGGNVASSFHGAMRSTMDVDIVAEVGLGTCPSDPRRRWNTLHIQDRRSASRHRTPKGI